jgi:hypothetical protein
VLQIHALLALLAALPRTVAVAQATAPSAAAWLFTWSIAPTAPGRGGAQGELLLDVAIWKRVARVTVRGNALTALAGAHGAMLVTAGDTTMTIVNPDKREVFIVPSGDLRTIMGGMAMGGGMQIDAHDVASRTTRRGAGQPVATYPTRRVTLDQRFTTEITVGTAHRAIRTEQRVDIDVSRDLSRLAPGFDAFAEQIVRSTGVPSSVRRQLRALERGVPAGFPSRVETTALTVSGTDSLATVTISALSMLRRAPSDTTQFLVPAGYRVTELSRLLRPAMKP